jgi:hypothetical protein
MWDYETSEYHLYLDVVPGAFGLGSAVTSTLIVSLSLFIISRTGVESAIRPSSRLSRRRTWRWRLDVSDEIIYLGALLIIKYSLVSYVFRTTGQVLGVSLSGALLQSLLLTSLRKKIQGPGSAEVSGFVLVEARNSVTDA